LAHRHAAFGTLLRSVGRAIDTRPDERLLADFYTHRDEAAFTTLVRRHQRTVWTVCARVLNEPADAEDAFQATFLVLARSGRMLADRGSVGGWLYRVAERVARKARTMAINRKRYERRAGRSEASDDRPADGDLFAIVSAELDRLPELHRLAVILCDLDGLSRADAATRLGWNEGTLSARLHRGRKQLADRLRARGIAPVVGLAAVLATPSAVPAQVAASTAALARTVLEVGLTNRAVPATVAALVSQTTREMAMRITTKVLATITLAAGVIGFGWLGLPGGTEPRANAAPVPETKKEAKPDVSPSALQLLRNRKVLRELKCTPEQRVTIEDHFDDQAEANQAKGGDVLDIAIAPGGNPNAAIQQLEAKMKERQEAEAAETKTAVEKVLKSAQLLRLMEIDLQVRGAEAFTDPKVADTLKLTDDQKKAIEDAIEDGKGTRNVGGQAAPLPPAPGGVVIRGMAWSTTSAFEPKARKAAYEKAEEALTKEQKATWKKMVGEAVSGFDPHAMWVNRGGAGATIRMGAPLFAPAMPAVPGVPLPIAPPPKKDDK
jgi:RNA polymerase sigma factor (sigma-70 family)